MTMTYGIDCLEVTTSNAYIEIELIIVTREITTVRRIGSEILGRAQERLDYGEKGVRRLSSARVGRGLDHRKGGGLRGTMQVTDSGTADGKRTESERGSER